MRQAWLVAGVMAVVLTPSTALAQSALSGQTIQITRVNGHISIDGDLSDEGWRHATRIDTWYETQPGDNTEPKVKNVGYLTYDERFLYAAFEFEDPDPSAILYVATPRKLPNADNAIDLTIRPDFSQVESDTAQIATNQRFALFFPERRPFFLEGVDMFSTPIQAVYTRTITDPIGGGRITGKAAGIRYTALVAEDDGGGSVVLPGATSSSLAPVDFGSTVIVGRAKRDIGLSFVSVLATDREHRGDSAHNRVVGPDVQWRPDGSDVVSAQYLFSETKTPIQPDLVDEWTGQTLTGHALHAQWIHNTKHFDWSGGYRGISSGFRADTGFVPQVGFHDLFGQTGWTVRPSGFLSRVRTFSELAVGDLRRLRG